MTSLRRINQDDLRNHNLSVVLDSLLRATDQLSRADLAKETGLTKATMSVLVSLLMDNGVLEEGVPTGQSLYGRPSIPLLIRGGRLCGIGLQINTDGYGIAVLDINGTTVDEQWVDADMTNANADEVFRNLDELAKSQEASLDRMGYTLVGSGLALPGLVTDDLRLLGARNLGWEQLDLKTFDVVRRLNPKVDNEANAAALAQIPGYATQRRGIGLVEPTDSFIYLSTDVGIGGAGGGDGPGGGSPRWCVTAMWCGAIMGSAANSAMCRWICADRSAVAVAADAWRCTQAVDRWSARPASPAAMPRPRTNRSTS